MNAAVSVLAALDPMDFAALRRRQVLEHCKWDPQVGDAATLAPFPIVLARAQWKRLSVKAELLAAELQDVEAELTRRPDLHFELGIPLPLRRALRRIRRDGATPAAARVMRFDFHPVATGWCLSEVNSDVPGGYTEASRFTALMAARYPGLRPAGDPASALVSALANAARGAGNIALLVAPGFMEDLQIVALLAKSLDELGCQAHVATADKLVWAADGSAHLHASGSSTALDAVLRFYQAEWLPRLPRRTRWQGFIAGGRTAVANPGTALLTESKRLPLVWDRIASAVPTWREMLPETRDPRSVPWQGSDDWVLKPAYGNNGDDVAIPGQGTVETWRAATRSARWWPRNWVVQRRFESTPVDTPEGSMHLCLGVYVIDGRAAGAYGRLARKPVIDFESTDAAVLIAEEGA